MKFYIQFLFFVLVSFTTYAQKGGDAKEEEDENNYSEKCNCNSRQFQERNIERFNDAKYLSEYLLDFKVDSGGDNKDYVYSIMKDKLSVSLAKKIRSKITSVETHTISEKSANNTISAQDDYTSTSKNESNVDLSGTGFRICPDKKQPNIYHGVIFINKTQFLNTQISLYKLQLKELETQVNNVSKNSMDYSMRELSKELSNCTKKKDKIDQIAIIYSSVSTNNEILNDPEIQKINDNIIPKLVSLRKRVYNKDMEKKVDSAKGYLDAKKFPEAMNIIDQVLKINPDHEQMKELQKQCIKNWTDEANYKIDDYMRTNDYEGALTFINKTLSYKIAVTQMNEKLNSVSELFFNDLASKVQSKVDAKDVISAKKYLKKIQPYSKINQSRYDELSKAVAKLDW